MAGIGPEDVDVAELYDAFTINTILFLEDLGFCPKGEGGSFVASGRIRPGAELPVNTNGGGLSYCHPGMYGLLLLIEAVRQLRGECGIRQVLGPRLPLGARRRVKAWGAVILTDRGMSDDKLICSERPLDPSARHQVLRFFHFYAKCKGLLNFWRRRPGRNACEGWCEARQALARAQPRDDTWHGPPIEF